MGSFEIEDRRASTAEVRGRRLGEVAPKTPASTISDLLKTMRSNRKQHRLRGEDGTTLSRIAGAIDSQEGLSFIDKRKLLIIEADRRIEDGGFRTGLLLGVGADVVKLMKNEAEAEERREFFETARQLISEQLESK